MSINKKYTIAEVGKLNWIEHIRKRPGMYIGQVNNNGYMDIIKGIISTTIESSNPNKFSIKLIEEREGELSIYNFENALDNNWGYHRPSTKQFVLKINMLNALSKWFRIKFFDSKENKITEQYFEEGNLTEGKEIDAISCNSIQVNFLLDDSIWGADFNWNNTYFTHQLREFSYLHKNTKFEIIFKEDNEECKMIYFFKNGLKDRIDIEILNGIGSSYFESSIDDWIGDIKVEIAFAFRDYSVDAPYLKSYVNDYFTYENGSHVDALLKGLTYGVMKYFQKHELVDKYKISEKGIQENLIAALNIKLDAPIYSGCVKNKLANPEIIEPIAEYVSEMFFEKLEADDHARERLIRKFEM